MSSGVCSPIHLTRPFRKRWGRRRACFLRIASDVLRACARRGSLDSAIRDPQVNDFAAFFAAHPGITRVLFNGAAAEKLFFRFCGETLQGRAAARLPSTSPAYTLPYAQKLEIWRKELLR